MNSDALLIVVACISGLAAVTGCTVCCFEAWLFSQRRAAVLPPYDQVVQVPVRLFSTDSVAEVV